MTEAEIERIVMPTAFDKTGRKIQVGDVLKVHHFQGARWRKHYFMFKQVVGVKTWQSGYQRFIVSHLNMKDPEGEDGGYLLGTGHHADIEIVQGLDWYHDRPRALANKEQADG
jgi:hypothetical protein